MMMMITRCFYNSGRHSSSVVSFTTKRIVKSPPHRIILNSNNQHNIATTRLYHQTTTVSDRFTKLRKGQAGVYWKEVKQRKKKQRAENKKKQSVIDADITAASVVAPIHYLGPLGRPAFTEAKLQELLIPTSPPKDELITATTKTITETKSESSSEAQLYGDGLANVEALIGLNLKNTTGLGTSNRTPKMVWMEMEQKIQFEKPQFRMELYNLNEKGHEVEGSKLRRNGNLLHKVTAVTVIPLDILPSNIYEQMKAHQHVGTHTDYDWLELISVGIGSTKKRSTQLAALDQIALLKETSGIDLTLPKQQWMSLLDDPDDKQQQVHQKKTSSSSTQLSKEEEKEIFDLKYEQSVTLLELLQCSRIKYDHEEVVANTKVSKNAGKSRGKGRTRRKKKASNQKAWVAEAETMYNGKYYFSTGVKASNKKEAEKQALVALFDQNEESLLQTEADVYKQLMEESPSGKYVSTLSIPPLPETIYNNLHDSLGYHNIYNDNEEGGLTIITEREQHLERKQQHQLLKQRYERQQEESQRRRNEQQPNRHRNQRQAVTSSDESVSHYLYDQEHTKLKNQRERNTKAYTKMEDARRALPIYQIRAPLLEKLKSNQVVVISGGTGSGKSTQCPQYILEDALENLQAAKTRILVTQPRRIAAISVSERVSAERYEPKHQGSNKSRNQSSPPSSVGYAVRFKSKKPRANGGSIEFVTTGILLRRLLNGDDSLLEGVSHVMIDEVHERDINTDFLLILFRDLLKKRPDLKLILMSATLNAKSFSDYFSESNISNSQEEVADSVVPLLSVPAKPRHPVEVHYLEDLLLCDGKKDHDECAIINDSTTFSLSRKAKNFASSLLQYSDDQLQREYEKRTNDIAFAASSLNEENSISDTERIVNLKKALAMRKESSSSLSSPLPYFDYKKFDFKATMTGLISEIALQLCHTKTEDATGNNSSSRSTSGSILCFLPGMDEIKACTKYIEENCSRSSGNSQLQNRIQIIQLHSTIPQDDQQKVFEPAETYTTTAVDADGGTTLQQLPKIKLIFATNIAESSITIDDVIAVIDSGLVREMNFDANTAVDTMETNPISQASATQRLGRCGRVGPGQCYRLFSSSDIAANILKDRPIPEIQRTSLEATCLQTCSMMMNNNNQNHNTEDGKNDDVVGVKDFLSRAMDPPEDESIAFAMDRLTKLGAISMKTSEHDNQHQPQQSQSREYLTPLGRYLARLPLDPATGKMLVMGVVMKCLDPLLTAAACFSSKNAFHEPPALRDETKEIRKSFSDTSDIMGMVKA